MIPKPGTSVMAFNDFTKCITHPRFVSICMCEGFFLGSFRTNSGEFTFRELHFRDLSFSTSIHSDGKLVEVRSYRETHILFNNVQYGLILTITM